jgi:hypothetical protein
LVSGELNFESEPGTPLAEHLMSWYQGALDELVAADLVRLLAQGKLPADSVRRSGVPCGPPDGLWGFVAIARTSGGKYRRSPKVISQKNIDWFLGELKDPPQSAEIGIVTLDADGMPAETLLRVGFDYGDSQADGWLRLWSKANPDRRDGSHGASTAHDTAVAAFLRARAERANPSYGSIGDDARGWEKTSLESCLPMYIPTAERLPAGRRRLRGYSWVTIIATELVDIVGGVDGLRRSGAFVEVAPLADGGLWLQATDHLADFDAAALERVWLVLKPIIPAGMPRNPDPPAVGSEWAVVFRDSAGAA